MKSFFAFFLLSFAVTSVCQAQTTKYGTATSTSSLNAQEQQLMLGKIVVTLRNDAVSRLELNADQINDFDDIYEEYVEDKQKLDRKRHALVASYYSEMRESDSANDEKNETAAFIEDYWELKIKEDELEKYFFGKFQKAISPVKALGFFALEDAYLKDLYRNRLQDMDQFKMLLEPMGVALEDIILHGRD